MLNITLLDKQMDDLKLVAEEMTGTIAIVENSQYNNINAEKVILSRNVTARIFGRVEDVILNEGSVLNFHGKITGKVENLGGTIRVFPT